MSKLIRITAYVAVGIAMGFQMSQLSVVHHEGAMSASHGELQADATSSNSMGKEIENLRKELEGVKAENNQKPQYIYETKDFKRGLALSSAADDTSKISLDELVPTYPTFRNFISEGPNKRGESGKSQQELLASNKTSELDRVPPSSGKNDTTLLLG